MNEEKNIMKQVILFFDNSLNVSVQVYMSLETLNKIKRGEWEYPFVQYTNGKETFDGDIVNCGYLFNGSPFDELDEYEEEKGVVKLSNCDCGFSIKFKNDTNLFIDVIKSCENIEVIGNIYENKELLG